MRESTLFDDTVSVVNEEGFVMVDLSEGLRSIFQDGEDFQEHCVDGDKEIHPDIFIFDELSNVGGWCIAVFSRIYEQGIGDDILFAGIPCIFIGCHRQMKVVKTEDSRILCRK